MSLSIRNQIQESVKERMADIVTAKGYIKGRATTLLKQAVLSGLYTGNTYRRFNVVVKSTTQVGVTEWFEEKAPLAEVVYNIATPIDIIAGQCVLTITASVPLVIGDSIDVRFNDKTFTVRQALRFEKAQPSKVYPSVSILPMDEYLNKRITDRYDRDLKLAIEFRLDVDNKYWLDFEEAIADIEEEFQRDHHIYGTDKVSSLCYEIFIERIQIFNTEYQSEWLGGVMFACVRYRSSEHNSRYARN